MTHLFFHSHPCCLYVFAFENCRSLADLVGLMVFCLFVCLFVFVCPVMHCVALSPPGHVRVGGAAARASAALLGRVPARLLPGHVGGSGGRGGISGDRACAGPHLSCVRAPVSPFVILRCFFFH